MRALCSRHWLLSPLLACCYSWLVHAPSPSPTTSTKTSTPPPPPPPSGPLGLSPPSSSSSTRVDPHDRRKSTPSPQTAVPHQGGGGGGGGGWLMESGTPNPHHSHHPSFPEDEGALLLHSFQLLPSDQRLPSAGRAADTSVKWTDRLQAKASQLRSEAERRRGGRPSCTHTRFPKGVASFVGTPGFGSELLSLSSTTRDESGEFSGYTVQDIPVYSTQTFPGHPKRDSDSPSVQSSPVYPVQSSLSSAQGSPSRSLQGSLSSLRSSPQGSLAHSSASVASGAPHFYLQRGRYDYEEGNDDDDGGGGGDGGGVRSRSAAVRQTRKVRHIRRKFLANTKSLGAEDSAITLSSTYKGVVDSSSPSTGPSDVFSDDHKPSYRRDQSPSPDDVFSSDDVKNQVKIVIESRSVEQGQRPTRNEDGRGGGGELGEDGRGGFPSYTHRRREGKRTRDPLPHPPCSRGKRTELRTLPRGRSFHGHPYPPCHFTPTPTPTTSQTTPTPLDVNADRLTSHRNDVKRRRASSRRARRASEDARTQNPFGASSTRQTPDEGSASSGGGGRRGRRSGSDGADGGFGRAAYMSGREMMRLRPAAVVAPGQLMPAERFTVDLWVKPEGGQFDPAVILALTDTCGGLATSGHWTLGIQSHHSHHTRRLGATPPADARFFFSLQTARAPRASEVWAHHRYRPGVWAHVAATYDGSRTALYVNGAQIDVSHDQSREAFPRAAAPCKVLTLGGKPRSVAATPGPSLQWPGQEQRARHSPFRGTVDELRLWRRALNHTEIGKLVRAVVDTSRPGKTEGLRSGAASVLAQGRVESGGTTTGNRDPRGPPSPNPDLYLHDRFDHLHRWTTEEGGRPFRLVTSDLTLTPHDLKIPVPLCGQTVCDNPDVVVSYLRNWQLRSAKRVRYRVVNVMNDDGSNPTVTQEKIEKQNEFLNRAFRPYNISFALNVHQIRNSTLRQRLIMFGCQLHQVGDGICNDECMHTQTGQDGGDCDAVRSRCDPSNLGNGRCDFECNKRYHDWDGGDCCSPAEDAHYTCYDPDSPYRAYVTVEELREHVALRGDTHLNVFIAVFSDWSTQQLKATHLIGLATFPWENHVYSVHGGAVIQHQTFGTDGQMDSLVHEVGHVLGLWHVHHGVSEVECHDPCAETHASLLLGDLCADTAPTSQNVHCRDPGPSEDQCGQSVSYVNTPYSNYMSYADDNCTNHFTPQQVSRMHCYLDLVYRPWRRSKKPSPVPLPPQIVTADSGSVTLAWLPPLGPQWEHQGSLCSLCDRQGALVQFAARATSPAPSSAWSPQQATGPPNAEPCVPSTRAWLPDVAVCDKSSCRLDLFLHVPVVARSLTLWVTWNADGIRRLRLVYEDGSTSVLKAVPASCDMPFTVTLNDSRVLHKIQVFTGTPFTAVDAVQIASSGDHPSCLSCQPITYRIFRRPAMMGQYFRLSQDNHFTDRNVDSGVRYLYWVETVSERSTSQPSPLLNYTHGQHFCGDGRLDRNDQEECDDGNLLPGDGCDVTCHVEQTFHCKEEPSVCYRHDGDGVCEDFERETSVQDCGFYTPPDFLDQWAHHALANPRHQRPACPPRLATGPPDRRQVCGPVVDPGTTWFPCGAVFDTDDFWIELYVPRPVVTTAIIVHLAADGQTEADPAPKNMTLHLIRADNSTRLMEAGAVTLDCRQQQIHVSVTQDLNKPFYKSRGVRLSFQSSNISIAAVRLRSYRYLDPVTLASCGSEEVYNPHTGLCLSRNCSRTPCGAPSVRNGATVCTGHAEGDVCRVTCHDGYRPDSQTSEISCRGGHWLSLHPVVCLAVDCGRPSIPGAEVTCAHGTTFGQNCTLRCLPPSALHGSDNWITCEQDGMWSTPRAQCLVTCPPPLHLQHVRVGKKKCRSGSLAVGSRCKMRCKEGYQVAGARRASRRVFRLTCESDGTWSGGHCQRVRCPKFDPIFTGLLTCTDDVKVASRCTLRCPGSDDTQTVTCQANGQWDTPLTRCPQFDDVTCPDLDDVTKLVLRCSPPVVGAQCSVSCPTPDEDAVFSLRYRGKRSKRWEVVQSITCTGSGQWFPPLDRVSCIEQCSLEFIGDKWCDAVNNRQFCQWDGGDCCRSTLGAKVKPFPQSCGAACTCKDPRAVENGGKRSGRPAKRRGKG